MKDDPKKSNICGVCKSNTLRNPVVCVSCKTHYHKRCASKLQNVGKIEEDSFCCCKNDSHEQSPKSEDMEASLNESFLSTESAVIEETLKQSDEIRYLKAIIKGKNSLINELKEKNHLSDMLSMIRKSYDQKSAMPQKITNGGALAVVSAEHVRQKPPKHDDITAERPSTGRKNPVNSDLNLQGQLQVTRGCGKTHTTMNRMSMSMSTASPTTEKGGVHCVG